jgi:hypothetical protein
MIGGESCLASAVVGCQRSCNFLRRSLGLAERAGWPLCCSALISGHESVDTGRFEADDRRDGWGVQRREDLGQGPHARSAQDDPWGDPGALHGLLREEVVLA